MSAKPPSNQPVLMPAPLDLVEPYSVATASYHTEHELGFYLRGLRHVCDGRLVAVVALRPGGRVPPADLPTTVRLIQTAAPFTVDPDQTVGWFTPDPLKAVVLALTGLQKGEGLILLFPHDWAGPDPEELVAQARRWRAGPHSPEDDVFFAATHPN